MVEYNEQKPKIHITAQPIDGDWIFSIKDNGIVVSCMVRSLGKTGVEMEALTGVSIALLTIYDMCKSHDKTMTISDLMLLKKSGGKSGTFNRDLN